MINGTVSPACERQFRILIKSIGTASPSASAAVAKGLGLPASTVISRLYRAPAILVDGITEPIAHHMAGLLDEIGYEAEVQGMTLPVPSPSTLLDVSIYVKDVRQFQHVVQRLVDFVGVSEADAARMILSPPGVVLGSVSEATVKAFSEQLGSGVSILTSQPDAAQYDLFLGDDENADVIRRRILADITDYGLHVCGDVGLVSSNVGHVTAQKLWKRHQASGLLRVVNQDFLRFDLVLQSIATSEGADSAQTEILIRTGVPAEMVNRVLQAAPITLMESVPTIEVTQHMTEFAKVGLDVRADLTTFQMLGLEVLSLSDRAALLAALEDLGLSAADLPPLQPPFHLPGVMPELQARIARAALEDAGTEVAFVEQTT